MWAATEGNPLFVEELLAASKKRPDAAWTTSQMPLGIREAMRAHLSMVSERALALLEIASVLGREPALALLRSVAGSPRSKRSTKRFYRAFCATRERAVCVFRTFSCAMSSMRAFPTRSARRCTSKRLAPANTQPPPPTTRCSGREPKTLTPRSSSCKPPCARHRESWPTKMPPAWDVGRSKRSRPHWLRPMFARSWSRSARPWCSPEMCPGASCGERAAVVASELGLHELLARAVLIRAVEITFIGDASVVSWLRKALEALPDGDSSLRAQLTARLALALNNTPTAIAEQRRLVDVAVGMARRLGDEKVLFTALHNAAGSFPDELTPRARFALYAETIDLAERTGTIGKIAPILTWHIVSWLELGEPEGALVAADRVERMLEPYSQPNYRWRLPLVRAMLAAVAGRFSEADRLSRVARDLPPARDLRRADDARHLCLRNSIPPWRRWGLAELYPSIERMLPPLPLSRVFKAIWEAPLGHVDSVRESIELLKTLPVQDVVGAAQVGWACVRAGLSEYAELFYDLASKRPDGLTFAPGGFACIGPLSLLVGQLAAMTGRRDEAAQRFARAVQVSREIKSPPLIAQSGIAWAEMLATESSDAASEHARVAFEQASLVGMDVVVARAEKLMKARQPPRTQPAAAGSRCLYVAWERCGRSKQARHKSRSSIPRE